MITPPTPPSPGRPVSAGFFSRLIGWIRSGQLVEGPGYRLHRTPNGTSLEIPRTSVPGAPGKVPGCFDIVYEQSQTDDSESASKSASFKNRYYMIGGKTYSCPMTTIQVPTPGLAYLEIDLSSDSPTATVNTCGDISSIPRDDDRLYCVPLYEFDENGSVVCDMRTIPSAAAWEMSS